MTMNQGELERFSNSLEGKVTMVASSITNLTPGLSCELLIVERVS